MDFTREPIIETVITPREGCTLVIRNSKGSGQEEYFVDALEVVIFGNAIFFRSRERPKAFLVPATDYEVLEVRETRMVLKNVGLDRSIKIAGGREASLRTTRESAPKSEHHEQPTEKQSAIVSEGTSQHVAPADVPLGVEEPKLESRIDKKRDRRRNYRRRRGREEDGKVESDVSPVNLPEGASVELPAPSLSEEVITASASSAPLVAVLSSLLAPPPNLISETIARYKDNALFKGAFFLKDEEGDSIDEAAEEQEDDTSAEDESEDMGQSYFENDYSGVDPLKPENVKIELPQMSLDFPVYVPHEMSSGEECSAGKECSQTFEECLHASHLESPPVAFNPDEPQVEEELPVESHERMHYEPSQSEQIHSDDFADELLVEDTPPIENNENEVSAENSSYKEVIGDDGHSKDEHQ